VPLFRILVLYFAVQSITFPFSSVLTGIGFPQINSKLVFLRALILVPSLVLISIYARGSILAFLITFCTISIVFDLIKLIISTKKIDAAHNFNFKYFMFEFILFISLFFVFIFTNVGFHSIIRLGIGIFFLMVYFLLFLLYDKDRSRRAIKMIINKDLLRIY